MIIEFDSKFYKSLKKSNLTNELKAKVNNIILDFEQAKNISEINQIVKIKGFKNFFRIRINDYRIGFKLIEDNRVKIILIAHRKEIYKIFP